MSYIFSHNCFHKMLVRELGPRDPCPLHGEGTVFVDCCGRRSFTHFPDQEVATGVLIPSFAVARGDGTGCVVIGQKTIRVFCHPLLDMAELDAWLVARGTDPNAHAPVGVVGPMAVMDKLLAGKDWKVLLLTNGATAAFKFMGEPDDISEVLREVWHYETPHE